MDVPIEESEAFLLDDRLRHWLEELKNEYRIDNAVRVLTGGPGVGKSSSIRKFAAEISREVVGLGAIYVPLHLLGFQGNADRVPDSFCSSHMSRFPDGLLSPRQNYEIDQSRSDRLLLIFDGLDELAGSGDVGAEAASNFVVAVHKVIEICGHNRQLAVLFCGRPVAVSKATHRFIADQHAFHLLPCFPSGNDMQWSLELLKGKGKDFEKITAVPLLNFLLALTLGRWKSNPEASRLDQSGAVDLNEAYQEMLNGVLERRDADDDTNRVESGSERVHPAAGQLSRKEFGKLLEDSALATWHSAGRVTSMEQVLAHLNSEQETRFKVLSEDTSTSVRKQLQDFYIRSRQLGQGQELFEFTHKSFGEYLTARRLLIELEKIHDDWKVSERSTRGNNNPLNQALVDWIEVFGPTAIEDGLLRFMHREFQRGHVAAARLEEWRQFLGTLMTTVLNDGLPMKKVLVDASFHERNRQAIHAEQALLILHDCASAALNRLAEERIAPTKIVWPQETSLGTWLHRLVEQRSSSETTSPVLSSLRHLWLVPAENESQSDTPLPPKQSLFDAWLCGANLRGMNLMGAGLARAYLIKADLRGANLCEAFLGEANLCGADLRRADLRGTYLRKADLNEAKLGGAKLHGANLSGANLCGAYLRRADLRRVDLCGADLSEAKLHGASLGAADLGEADLSRTDLGGADLRGAKVSNSQLESSRGTPSILPDGTEIKPDA